MTRNRKALTLAAVPAAVLSLMLTLACGASVSDAASAGAATGVAVEVAPSSVVVNTGGSATFAAAVTGTAVTSVTWSADCGSVTSGGLYTAPSSATTCRVTATSTADGSKSGSATVVVGSAAPVEGWGQSCASEAIRTTGKVYYVCDCQSGADSKCVAGNDSSGDGSKGNPYKSWSKVNSLWTSMAAGSTIALCRGGRFDGNTVQGWGWVNRSCGTGADSTCILRDYAPSTFTPAVDARPVIAVSGTNNGPMLGGGPGLVQGYRFLNLNFVHTSAGSQSSVYGLQAGDNSNDIEVCNSVFDGFYVGAYVQLGQCAGTGGHRRHFRGNLFLNNCGDGALLDTHDSDWDGNYFDNNGHDACGNYAAILNPSGGTTHTWYLSSRCDAQNVRFINNEVHRSSFYQGHCTQASVVTGGMSTGLVIENNYFDGSEAGGNCGAFFGGNTYTDGSYHGPRNVVVRGNYIKQYSGGAIGYAAAANALIENNIIEIQSLTNLGSYSSIIALPTQSNVASGSDMTAGGTVRNNTVYVASSGNNSQANAISVGNYDLSSSPTQKGFNVTGNAVYVASGGVLGACFRTSSKDTLAYMDNNLCSGASNWMQEGSSTYALASWQTRSGRDGASKTSAPGFTSAPSDFTPATGSALIGTGSTATTCTVLGAANQPCSSRLAAAGASWDPTASAVTRTSPPDIGAIEH